MHTNVAPLALCFLAVAGFRRGRPDMEHIGKSYKFLAAEPEEQADDGGVSQELWKLSSQEDEVPSVPLAMRLLLKKSECEVWPNDQEQRTGHEDFTPIAKSLSPNSANMGIYKNLAVINFTVPNEYSRAFGTNRTVWLVLTLNNATQDRPVTALLYDNHHSRGNIFVDSTQIDWNKNFILFNVTKFVKYSFRNQSLSFSFIVQQTEKPLNVSDVIELQGPGKGPVLVSTACPELSAINMAGDLRDKSRRRRSAEPSSGETASTTPEPETGTEGPVTSSCDCRLQEWAPSKDELGWSWLIRPEFVPINFCIGSCPVPLLNSTYNASSNAIARDYYRTIIKGRDPNLNHPEIHCVPIAYRPVAVLIESSPGIFSMERVSTLAVSQCGCR